MIQSVGKNCCGCSACASVCPKGAITMKENGEGFLFPQVDETACVNCSKCRQVCPALSVMDGNAPITVFAVKHKCDDVRNASTSGGIFTALSDYVLEQKGTVYGTVLDSNLLAVHERADSTKKRNAMRGSKYIQSDMGTVYSLLEADLRNDKKILFSGTPCQCAAIHNYVQNKKLPNEKLYLLEILCTGVNSPKLWQDYCAFRAGESKITNVEFRSKTNGWKKETIRICYGDIEYLGDYKKDPFCLCFSGSLAMRESCHNCPYAKLSRVADVTMGDFWAYSKLPESFVDDRGLSLVLINTEKGHRLFERVSEQIECIESDIETAVSRQAPLRKPVWRNPHRDEFWQCYKQKGLEVALRRFTDYGFLHRLVYSAKRLARRYIRK